MRCTTVYNSTRSKSPGLPECSCSARLQAPQRPIHPPSSNGSPLLGAVMDILRYIGCIRFTKSLSPSIFASHPQAQSHPVSFSLPVTHYIYNKHKRSGVFKLLISTINASKNKQKRPLFLPTTKKNVPLYFFFSNQR
jgi:hypothetical protein